jgi:hypothetical protein
LFGLGPRAATTPAPAHAIAGPTAEPA